MYYQKNSIEEFNLTFDLQSYVLDNYDGAERAGNYIKICCPFHYETTPSCIIYEHNFHCFGAGCGASGSAIDFLLRTTDNTISDILNNNISKSYVLSARNKTFSSKSNYPNLNLFKRYNKKLLNSPEKLTYLNNRHIDKHSIVQSGIGYAHSVSFFSNYKSPRYCIPVYDINKKLVTARYRIDPEYESCNDEPKYLGHPRAPVMLYNIHILPHVKDVVIVGSELDALFLYYRYGINAVAPPGEGNFNKNWAKYFVDKNVLVWFDYDSAGIMAGIKTYKNLKYYANVSLFEWSNEFKLKDDVCDFVTKYGILGVLNVFKKFNIQPYVG